MPTLDVVPEPLDAPDPSDRPEDAALAVAAPDVPADLTGVAGSPVALRWFAVGEPRAGIEVRAHVLMALNAWAVDTDTIADAMVLVSELVTNVRDHTPSDRAGVRVRVTGDRVVVAVVEESPAPAPRDRRPGPGGVEAADDVPAERGRGLQILDAMAAEWGFVRVGGVTTAWFALTATSPPGLAREPEIRRFAADG